MLEVIDTVSDFMGEGAGEGGVDIAAGVGLDIIGVEESVLAGAGHIAQYFGSLGVGYDEDISRVVIGIKEVVKGIDDGVHFGEIISKEAAFFVVHSAVEVGYVEIAEYGDIDRLDDGGAIDMEKGSLEVGIGYLGSVDGDDDHIERLSVVADGVELTDEAVGFGAIGIYFILAGGE